MKRSIFEPFASFCVFGGRIFSQNYARTPSIGVARQATPPDAERIAELVKFTLELPPEDRASFLDQECRSHPAMHSPGLLICAESELHVRLTDSWVSR
jgi:hypothetical protein